MITAESLAAKLQDAEQRREAAIAAAQHWEGQAAAYRVLLAEANRPEVDAKNPG